jgi:hypothetical protein
LSGAIVDTRTSVGEAQLPSVISSIASIVLK